MGFLLDCGSNLFYLVRIVFPCQLRGILRSYLGSRLLFAVVLAYYRAQQTLPRCAWEGLLPLADAALDCPNEPLDECQRCPRDDVFD